MGYKHRNLTDEQKMFILLDIDIARKKGTKLNVSLDKHEISRSTYSNWSRKYKEQLMTFPTYRKSGYPQPSLEKEAILYDYVLKAETWEAMKAEENAFCSYQRIGDITRTNLRTPGQMLDGWQFGAREISIHLFFPRTSGHSARKGILDLFSPVRAGDFLHLVFHWLKFSIRYQDMTKKDISLLTLKNESTIIKEHQLKQEEFEPASPLIHMPEGIMSESFSYTGFASLEGASLPLIIAQKSFSVPIDTTELSSVTFSGKTLRDWLNQLESYFLVSVRGTAVREMFNG